MIKTNTKILFYENIRIFMINLSLPTWIPFLLSDKQFDNQTYFPDLMINWRCKTFPTVSWVRARCCQVSLGSSQDSILCQNLSTLLILLQVESHQSFVIFNKILILLTLLFSCNYPLDVNWSLLYCKNSALSFFILTRYIYFCR